MSGEDGEEGRKEVMETQRNKTSLSPLRYLFVLIMLR